MPKKKAKLKKTNKPELLIRPVNKTSQRLMWFSVILFTIIIAVLWGWSAKIQLSNINLQKTPENKLLKNTQAEWSSIFSDNNKTEKDKENEKIIKNNLETILSNLATSTTSSITVSTTSNTKTLKY